MKVKGFIRTLTALESRLEQIVITGGWCWYLYRKYLTSQTGLPGEFTLDVDLVLPRRMRSKGPALDQLLLAEDFELTMEGEERPPVSKYSWPSSKAPEAIVEFLTPAASGGKEATLEIDGIVAQQLRFLDLLLIDPLWLEIDEREGVDRFQGTVRVPRVGLFSLQKALTFRRRKDRAKRSKDLFYIFDLADEARGLLPRFEEDIRVSQRLLRPDRIREAARSLEEDCGSPESDAIGRIVDQIPQEQRPSRTYVADTIGELVRIIRRSVS